VREGPIVTPAMSSATVSGTDVGDIASQNNTAAVRPYSVETEPPYLSFLSSEALATYREVKQRVLHSKGDDVPTYGERYMRLSNRKCSLHLCSSLREAAPDGTWDKVVESCLDPPFTRLSDLLPVPDDVCESCLSNVEGAFLEATPCVKRLEDLQSESRSQLLISN